jgi:nitric oxide reductase NorE protein
VSIQLQQDPFRDPFAHVTQTPGASNGRPRGLPGDPRGKIPGETGIWVFIFWDMTLFTILFAVTVYTRGQHPAVFEHGRTTLTLWAGTLNSALLLTGSLFVVQGIRTVRAAVPNPDRARRLFYLAMVCGLGFIVNKGFEWGRLLHDGHHPGSTDFFTFFFYLTGFHLLHLLLGMVGLFYMTRVTRRPAIDEKGIRNLEVVGCYWHLVDLLWVVIFAILYTLR